jgi:hypothetical protein
VWCQSSVAQRRSVRASRRWDWTPAGEFVRFAIPHSETAGIRMYVDDRRYAWTLAARSKSDVRVAPSERALVDAVYLVKVRPQCLHFLHHLCVALIDLYDIGVQESPLAEDLV